jgi:PPK2 family polyphosphate:nucleotide phosphotransferase
VPESFYDRFRVRPGHKVHLHRWDPDDTAHYKSREHAEEDLAGNLARLSKLGHLLYAERKRAVLVVLQGMDTGGKDGTISHVMSGLNPMNCRATGFKAPSETERAHDFLWRIHPVVPGLGEIGIFNRSHYEDVLVVRVKNLAPKGVWEPRYDAINEFERTLALGGVTILKFFLHISKAEQARRLRDRLKDPAKNWKLSATDFGNRRLWGDYRKAYEAALARCSTPWAPWFVIPANEKWFRNLAVSEILVRVMEGFKMKFPKPTIDLAKVVIR